MQVRELRLRLSSQRHFGAGRAGKKTHGGDLSTRRQVRGKAASEEVEYEGQACAPGRARNRRWGGMDGGGPACSFPGSSGPSMDQSHGQFCGLLDGSRGHASPQGELTCRGGVERAERRRFAPACRVESAGFNPSQSPRHDQRAGDGFLSAQAISGRALRALVGAGANPPQPCPSSAVQPARVPALKRFPAQGHRG